MRTRYLLVAALVAAPFLPHRAEAQFGSLMKKAKEKAAQAVAHATGADSAKEKAAAATAAATGTPLPNAPAAGRRGRDVVDLTPELLAQLPKAVAAERAQAERNAPHPEKVKRGPVSYDRSNDPERVWGNCMEKYKGNITALQQQTYVKDCGSIQEVQKKQAALDEKRRREEAARPDSVRYVATPGISPDSAGAVAAGLSVAQYAIVKERVTAYAVLAGGGTGAACLRSKPQQYMFTDAESAALDARRDELTKLFLDPSDPQTAKWGRCKRTGRR